MLNFERCCCKIKNVIIKISSNDGSKINGGVFFFTIDEDEKDEKEESKMKQNENIYALANYLISLYDTLDKKYASSQVKIAKLLVIAELKCLYQKNESILPSDTKLLYSNCGIKIPALELPIGGIRIYISSGNEINAACDLSDDEQKLIESPNFEFFTDDEIKDIKNLDSETTKILTKVFLRFASYDAGALGLMLNQLKQPEDRGIEKECSINKLKEMVDIIKSQEKETGDVNEIVSFIRSNEK